MSVPSVAIAKDRLKNLLMSDRIQDRKSVV